MTTQAHFADWGTVLVETDIDRKVLECLRFWFPAYLAQAERTWDLDNGLLARPRPESFQNALQDDEFPDGMLPAVLATTARTEGDTQSGPDRLYSANWRAQVSVVVRGREPRETREVAAVFGGCVRQMLVHQQIALDGEVRWQSSEIVPVPDQLDQGRWLAAAVNRFTIYTDVALSGTGPMDPAWPPVDDNPPWDPGDPDGDLSGLPLVHDVDTTINAR
jgi:hypothetical protein